MPDAVSNQPRIDAEEVLENIRAWVEVETPSHDGAAVNRLVDRVEGELTELGLQVERVPGRDGFGDVLRGRSPGADPDAPGILVLAHLDTVHPHGSLAGPMPWRREDDVVWAPGIYDMKAGGCMALYAYRHLLRLGRSPRLPVTFLFIPEEEVGSPTSQARIADEARRAKYALVMEPARDGGQCVIGRKGAAIFKVTTEGRAAHAGMRHRDGRSAIREMARQILKLEAMTDYETGLTVNVGTIAGGSGTNVVPAACEIMVDMRIPSPDLVEEAVGRVLGLTAEDPDVKLSVEGGINRPPYQPDAGIMALFEKARELAAEDGWELVGQVTGGGSDGNFTAALGVPTLDGLGADGRGAHALDEQIYVSSIAPRVRLVQRLFETLE